MLYRRKVVREREIDSWKGELEQGSVCHDERSPVASPPAVNGVRAADVTRKLMTDGGEGRVG